VTTYLIESGDDVAAVGCTMDEAINYCTALALRLRRPVTLWGETRGARFDPTGRVTALPSGELLEA